MEEGINSNKRSEVYTTTLGTHDALRQAKSFDSFMETCEDNMLNPALENT